MALRSIRLVLIFAAASLAGLLYFYYSPYTDTRFPGCALYALTGFYCPACGSQRAFSDLLHGHVLSACRNNMLFVAALSLFLYWYMAETKKALSGAPAKKIRWPKATPWIVLGIVAGFFLLRNLPFAPFQWLAPAK